MRTLRHITTAALLLTVEILSAQSRIPDSVAIRVTEQHDSIALRLTAFKIETQLTFLMQGLNISILQDDTLTVAFPSAFMVRNKVRHHPNEVKAVLASRGRSKEGNDSIHHVVRPDVQPLVAALNDTTATITYRGKSRATRAFAIVVDRDHALMTFRVQVPKEHIKSPDGSVNLQLLSLPKGGDRPEFAGRRLSGEKSPVPNGLGEGIRKEDAANRTFRKTVNVKTETTR